jgi:hypothetical protein
MAPTSALHQLAAKYFAALARKFPVMCASDEFHFMPRVQRASSQYHRLDCLEQTALAEVVDTLISYRSQFHDHGKTAENLESQIDAVLLEGSVNGLLVEFEQTLSWRYNPLLYLKIALIGLDHAWSKPALSESERRDRTLSRLDRIPGLLAEGIANLSGTSRRLRSAAQAMTCDSRRYLIQWLRNLPARSRRRFEAPVKAIIEQLGVWEKFVERIAIRPNEPLVSGKFHTIINDIFLSRRSPNEIFTIAEEEWHRNNMALEQLRRRIDPSQPWPALYHGYHPRALDEVDTLSLYRKEYEALKRYFIDRKFFGMAQVGVLKVEKTPFYLHSVRSSASFAAAFSRDKGEYSHFYISPDLGGNGGSRDPQQHLRKRLNREFRFLSAHETVPGHHLIDSVRRSLKNPVRRQIESALFYEGWAYYAETLLAQYGYVSDPMAMLVDRKRRMWRAARCQIDTGLSTGRMSEDAATDLLVRTGFNTHEARRQIDRFQLNPGYQVCYTLGRFEIEQLKRQWAPKIGEQHFHALLLEGGQLPFHLAERRFKTLNPVS